MRNQKPFTKQRIFDKAPGENANPLKRVKGLIEKTLRSHLGNGWTYANLTLDSNGLMNNIYEAQADVENNTITPTYFYFGDEAGKRVNPTTPTALEYISSLKPGQTFKVYICTNEVVGTRTGKKQLEKIHFIVNVTKTNESTYVVPSYWQVTQSPEKFEPAAANKFVKDIFIPAHAQQLDQSDYKLINDAVRFWHTL